VDDIVGNVSTGMKELLLTAASRNLLAAASMPDPSKLGFSTTLMRAMEESWVRLLTLPRNWFKVMSGEFFEQLRNDVAQVRRGNSVAFFHLMHGVLTMETLPWGRDRKTVFASMRIAERSFRIAAELPSHLVVFNEAAAYFAAYSEALMTLNGEPDAELLRQQFRHHAQQLATSATVGPETLGLIAEYAAKLGDFSSAERLSDRARDRWGVSNDWRLRRARLEFARGAASEAVEQLCTLLDDDPANAEARALLEKAKDEVGRVGPPGQSLLLDDYLDEHLVEWPAVAPPSGSGG
jgi:hypothetical protein